MTEKSYIQRIVNRFRNLTSPSEIKKEWEKLSSQDKKDVFLSISGIGVIGIVIPPALVGLVAGLGVVYGAEKLEKHFKKEDSKDKLKEVV
jgi:hypothetical protein